MIFLEHSRKLSTPSYIVSTPERLVTIIMTQIYAVFLKLYLYRDGIDNDIMSVNGSSKDGNCNLITKAWCRVPTTSVLQDGIIPTLTGQEGDMWSSQLLTINTTKSNIDITFNFQDITPSYDGLEVVMFNCRKWGTSVDNITLFGNISYIKFNWKPSRYYQSYQHFLWLPSVSVHICIS